MAIHFWTAVLLLGLPVLSGQEVARVKAPPSQDNSNAYCAEKVRFPTYTPLARNAGLQGTIVVTLTVGSGGMMEKFSAESHLNVNRVQAALVTPVEFALRKSHFKPDCRGKQVVLIFEFRISGDENDRVQQDLAFGYPNRLWITARPGALNFDK